VYAAAEENNIKKCSSKRENDVTKISVRGPIALCTVDTV
jgi:hypothetical protein